MEKNIPQGGPFVTIRCAVYNHEPYLRQCLDGFVMQETNFPFEAIVHDDASTDGSAAIIREYAEKYPDIIKPIYETENQYSKGKLTSAFVYAQHPATKYIAMCEGDDYWTDPHKLQKQVDIMEHDPKVGMVHSPVQVYYEVPGGMAPELRGKAIPSFDEELRANHCVTLTICFRWDLRQKYGKFYNDNNLSSHKWKMGDYPFLLFMVANSKTHFLPESTGVYREQANSASHSTNTQKQAEFELSVYDVKEFFANYYHREYLMKDITTDLVKQLQYLSLNRNEVIDYDIMRMYKQYGMHQPWLRLAKHYMLKSDLLRNLYIKASDLKSLLRR